MFVLYVIELILLYISLEGERSSLSHSTSRLIDRKNKDSIEKEDKDKNRNKTTYRDRTKIKSIQK